MKSEIHYSHFEEEVLLKITLINILYSSSCIAIVLVSFDIPMHTMHTLSYIIMSRKLMIIFGFPLNGIALTKGNV